jgi:hypothetical protein
MGSVTPWVKGIPIALLSAVRIVASAAICTLESLACFGISKTVSASASSFWVAALLPSRAKLLFAAR